MIKTTLIVFLLCALAASTSSQNFGQLLSDMAGPPPTTTTTTPAPITPSIAQRRWAIYQAQNRAREAHKKRLADLARIQQAQKERVAAAEAAAAQAGIQQAQKEKAAQAMITNPYKSPHPAAAPTPTLGAASVLNTRSQIQSLQAEAQKAMAAAREQSEKASRLNAQAQRALLAVQRGTASAAPTKSPTKATPTRSPTRPTAYSSNPYNRQNVISPANQVPSSSSNSVAAKLYQLRATRMRMQAGSNSKVSSLINKALSLRRAQAAGRAAAQQNQKKAESPSNPYSTARGVASSVPVVRDTAIASATAQNNVIKNRAIAQRNMIVQRRRATLISAVKKMKAKMNAIKTMKSMRDQPKKDMEAMGLGCIPHPMGSMMGVTCKNAGIKAGCTMSMKSCVDIGLKAMCCPYGMNRRSMGMMKQMKNMQKMMEMMS